MVKACQSFLPYGRQDIDDDDIEAVVNVLKGDFLTTGPQVPLFETALCREFGAEHAVACSSGTAALHLAAMSIGMSRGDYVIVPSVTFLATANVFHICGATVVFSDVDPFTGLMMPENLLEAIQRVPKNRLKAIVNVHLNGQTGDPEGLYNIAKSLGVPLIEDACHAAGTSYHCMNGKIFTVGAAAHSDMVAYSFHPVKTLTTAEGGAVLTNNSDYSEALSSIRNHGMVREADEFKNKILGIDRNGNPNPWYYELHSPGLNYRLNDIQAALGISQLNKLKAFAERREILVKKYDDLFNREADCLEPVMKIKRSCPVWHLYVVQIDFSRCGMDRSSVMADMRSAGIGTQVHYLPLHMQPFYNEVNPELILPGAEYYYERALSLPLFTSMSDENVKYVADKLIEVLS